MPWFTADIKTDSTTNALFNKMMLERMAFIVNNFWQFGIVFTLCLPRKDNQNDSEKNQFKEWFSLSRMLETASLSQAGPGWELQN